MRLALKRCIQALFLVVTWPAALLCGFGRIEPVFQLLAHYFAVWPGFIGNFARAAFYRMTLERCSQDVVIAFGTFFSRRTARVEQNVSIGAYCVIGSAEIRARTQISSHVEIPGGAGQHVRDRLGRLSDTVETPGGALVIGEDCWIGASAIVMASVGARSTIGAGSVVTKEIPAGVVAVGTPARAIKASIPNGQSLETRESTE
jgi:acetyltransferase-like isoleucine patch superfamily enzyme